MLSSFSSLGLMMHSSAFSALFAPHLKQLVLLLKFCDLQTHIHPFLLPPPSGLSFLGAIMHSAAFSGLSALIFIAVGSIFKILLATCAYPTRSQTQGV